MMPNSKDMELFALYSQIYEDRHFRFWNLYLKFFYAIVFVLGIHLFKSNALFSSGPQNIKTLYLLLIEGIEALLTILSTLVLFKEHQLLLYIQDIRNSYADRLCAPHLDNYIESIKINPFSAIAKRIKTGNLLLFTILGVGIFSIIIIFITISAATCPTSA